MPTAQTTFTEAELLETHAVAEPLIAGGVRCHGGFDADGQYVSPRTKYRWPAIRAWQAQHAERSGAELVGIPLEAWPPNYPNVAQAKHLIRSGVPEPIIETLTRIGTIEGFGASIRNVVMPDLPKCFEEDLGGTATLHLDRGLFEAHARDEAGFEDEGGHKQMWFAARDLAFPGRAPSEDEIAEMMKRRGFPGYGSGQPSAEMIARMREQMKAQRLLSDDVDFDLEVMITRMVRLMLIEISAFHGFAWAEAVLSDADLVEGDGEAARLVSYIRADETPHVEYLKTSLSEMRDGSFVGASGKRYPGRDIVGRIWDTSLEASLGANRETNLRNQLDDVERALEGHPRREALLEEFHALGDLRPRDDGTWLPPELGQDL